MVSARAKKTLSGMEFLQAMSRGDLPYPPIMATLNFGQVQPEIEPGKVTFFFQAQEYHYNPIGSVHGGVLATLLDSALGCAIHSTLPAGVGFTKTDLSVSFVRRRRRWPHAL